MSDIADHLVAGINAIDQKQAEIKAVIGVVTRKAHTALTKSAQIMNVSFSGGWFFASRGDGHWTLSYKKDILCTSKTTNKVRDLRLEYINMAHRDLSDFVGWMEKHVDPTLRTSLAPFYQAINSVYWNQG